MSCLSLATIREGTMEELVWGVWELVWWSPAVDRDEVNEDSTMLERWT